MWLSWGTCSEFPWARWGFWVLFELCCRLRIQFNVSFETGKFPTCLKRAVVILLHKGGDSEDPSNFRPISLLTTLPKVVDKLEKSRLVHFVFAFDISNSSQFCFRESRSPSDAAFSLLERLCSSLNGMGCDCGSIFKAAGWACWI